MIRRCLRSSSVPSTTVASLAEELAAGQDVQVVDVREVSEWRAGHMLSARHIPLGELGQRQAELDRQRPTVIVCQTGRRSALATEALIRSGFPDVRNLDGGIVEWARAGHPIER